MRSGQIDVLTHQPKKGPDGGTRFGEMEFQALMSHGTAVGMQDVNRRSDPYQIYVCAECGVMAEGPKNEQRCLVCPGLTEIVCVKTPYATKLFKQELRAMGVSMRFMTGDEPEAWTTGSEAHTSESEEDFDVQTYMDEMIQMEEEGCRFLEQPDGPSVDHAVSDDESESDGW